MDTPRLVTNAEALLGAAEASTRVAALLKATAAPDEAPQTFVLKKRPCTRNQPRQIAEEWTKAWPGIVPGRHVEPPYGGLFSGKVSLEQFSAAAPERVDPSTTTACSTSPPPARSGSPPACNGRW